MYHFTLEPVLRHRKLIEEELQKEMAAAKRLLLSEKEKLLGLEESKSRCLRELQAKQAKGIRALDISLYSDFIGQVTIQIEAQGKRVVGVERSLAKKRKTLVKAMKERKTVDQLKKNRLMAYERNERRKEQKWIDEIALAGFQKSQNAVSS
jgi:flagellar FliJ protein